MSRLYRVQRVAVVLFLVAVVNPATSHAATAQTVCNQFCMTVGPDATGVASVELSWANIRPADAVGYLLVRSTPSGVTVQGVPAPGSYRDPAPELMTCYVLLPVLLSSNPHLAQQRSSFPLCYVPAHSGQVPVRLTVQTSGFCIACPVDSDRVSAQRTGASSAITVLAVPLSSPGAPGVWIVAPDAPSLPPVRTSLPSVCYLAAMAEGARTDMVCSLYGTIPAAGYAP